MTDAADQSDQPSGTTAPLSREAASLPSTGPVFERTDWASCGLTVLVLLVVYLRTLAPEVTLEFSGLLSTSAAYGGVAYPPGFPVWTLYSWVFVTVLPFGSFAWRVAVGSAVAAALACGLVALMVSRGGIWLLKDSLALTHLKPADQKLLRLVCGYVAGMVLGLSRPVWRVAVVAENWALSVLLFTVTVCLLTRWIFRPDRARWLWGAAFVFGLLLTSNQELIVVAPSLLLAVLVSDRKLGRDLSLPVAFLAVTCWAVSRFVRVPWLASYISGNAWLLAAFLVVGVGAAAVVVATRRFGSEWKSASLCAVCLLVGLGCCLYLPVASMTNPPSNWSYARTMEGFSHLVTRGQYERPQPTGQVGRFIEQLWTVLGTTSRGLGWFYFPFMALPFCVLRRAGRCAQRWLLALAAVFLGTGPLLVALLNLGSDKASMDLIAPCFGAMYVVLAVWTGLGLMVFGSFIARFCGRSQPNAEPVS